MQIFKFYGLHMVANQERLQPNSHTHHLDGWNFVLFHSIKEREREN